MKDLLKALKVLLILLGCFFGITFIIYFFYLDMKAGAAVMPYLDKWYDRRPKEHVI